MKNCLRNPVAAGAVSLASASFAADLVVLSHGRASDPFWSMVNNGVDRAARRTFGTAKCGDISQDELQDLMAGGREMARLDESLGGNG